MWYIFCTFAAKSCKYTDMKANAKQIIKDCMRITDLDIFKNVKILSPKDLSANRCGSYQYAI